MSPYVLPDLNLERCQVTIDRHASKSRDSCNVSQISQPAVKLWNRSSVQYTFYFFPLHTYPCSMDSRRLYVWASLFGLPLAAVLIVISLPFFLFSIGTHGSCLLWISWIDRLLTMTLYTGAAYCIAWMLYLRMAQTDAKFNLPLNPSRVYKANVAFIQLLVGWITDMPLIVTYLQWRWHVRKDFSQLIK